MRHLIFVVDDNIRSRQLNRLCLEEAGYKVRVFSTSAPKFAAEVEEACPTLILIGLRGGSSNGLELIERFRHGFDHPASVLFLIEATDPNQHMLARESGGAYITTPLTPADLQARVRTLIEGQPERVRFRDAEAVDLVIDNSAMTISVRGTAIPTTSLEFRLIEYLARHRGRAFTRDLLLDAVWGEMRFVTPRSVDACIRRIREKIEPNRSRPTYLKTVRGVGYRLDAIATWPTVYDGACGCSVCRSPVERFGAIYQVKSRQWEKPGD